MGGEENQNLLLPSASQTPPSKREARERRSPAAARKTRGQRNSGNDLSQSKTDELLRTRIPAFTTLPPHIRSAPSRAVVPALGQEMPRTMGHFQIRKWQRAHRALCKKALAHPLHREGYDGGESPNYSLSLISGVRVEWHDTVSRGRDRAAPLPTHLLRICAGALKRRALCAVSKFASGKEPTSSRQGGLVCGALRLPHDLIRLPLLFPQNSPCDFCGIPESQESTCSPLTQGGQGSETAPRPRKSFASKIFIHNRLPKTAICAILNVL